MNGVPLQNCILFLYLEIRAASMDANAVVVSARSAAA
jgi:hypothetical protein